jgi:cell division protein FtsZ
MTILIAAVGRRGADCVAQLPEPQEVERRVFLDTDRDDLARQPDDQRVLLGSQLPIEEWTRNDPGFSFKAAMAERGRLMEMLRTVDGLIVVAGLGGGTGAGASRALVTLARELNVPVVAVVTHPFSLEGEARTTRARRGFRDLRPLPDVIISFYQDQVLPFTERFTRLRDTVSVVDQCVVEAVTGLVHLVASTDQDKRAREFLGHANEGLASFGLADRPLATGRATELALANPFLAGIPWQRAEAVWLELTSREPLDQAALDQAHAVLAHCLEGREVPLIIGTTHEPQALHPLHVRLYALGDFGQPQPPLGDFFVPGPTG